jgi:steroid 5-alpha reductase family enzyme
MEILIIWALFGVACYAIAKNKNRNEWVGALCGVLFGIFALVYYLIVDKKEE